MRVGCSYVRRSIILVALTLGGAGCSSSTGPEERFESARERWVRHGIDSYSVTISRSCNCPVEWSEPAVVVVRNGVVESRTYVRTGLAVLPENAERYPAIEGLFEDIEQGLENGSPGLSVRYHPILGFPTRYVFGDPDVDAPVTFARDLVPL